MALVTDRGFLRWDGLFIDLSPTLANPPSTLRQLHSRTAAAVAGGLLDVTAHLVHQKPGSRERAHFVKAPARHEEGGCRVPQVVEKESDGARDGCQRESPARPRSLEEIYSDAASATRHVTLHAFPGDVLVRQPDAYEPHGVGRRLRFGERRLFKVKTASS